VGDLGIVRVGEPLVDVIEIDPSELVDLVIGGMVADVYGGQRKIRDVLWPVVLVTIGELA
jgi:hypothetical protein